jgi:hypothetical protein
VIGEVVPADNPLVWKEGAGSGCLQASVAMEQDQLSQDDSINREKDDDSRRLSRDPVLACEENDL